MADEPDTPDTPTPTPVSASHHHSHTDVRSADRTGQLVKAVAEVVHDQRRATLMLANEPDTDVSAPVILTASGEVKPLPASTFDDYRGQPKHLIAKPGLTRIESFIDLVNRHKLPASVIFAQESETQPAMQAVIDYHHGSESPGALGRCPSEPQFGHHIMSYPFPLSPEWKAWIDLNGKQMAMVDFAHFIEDRIVDVQETSVADLSAEMKTFIGAAQGKIATPTKLFELSRGLAVHENSNITEVRNLSTGEGEVVFASEHVDAKGDKLNIPNMFVILIPIWARSTDFYRIIARLRYRKTPNGLVFWYELWRADLTFQRAFDEVVKQVEEATDLPVFIGSR